MDEIKKAVREAYGRIATTENAGCCGPAPTGPSSSCCGPEPAARPADEASRKLGYSEDELASAPEGANLGLGCGNPQAIAALQPGETVLDLGSGAGFDCFLAANQVGPTGHVIGVDMTPEMLTKARENAAKAGTDNVEFRLGEIEHLPVADASVDVIISNCVINIAPDKAAVYSEAFRVLKPGGRLAISDVLASAPLPDEVRKNVALHVGCLAGASTVAELEVTLAEAGFVDVKIQPKDESRTFIRDWVPDSKLEDFVVSANIEASKP